MSSFPLNELCTAVITIQELIDKINPDVAHTHDLCMECFFLKKHTEPKKTTRQRLLNSYVTVII